MLHLDFTPCSWFSSITKHRSRATDSKIWILLIPDQLPFPSKTFQGRKRGLDCALPIHAHRAYISILIRDGKLFKCDPSSIARSTSQNSCPALSSQQPLASVVVTKQRQCIKVDATKLHFPHRLKLLPRPAQYSRSMPFPRTPRFSQFWSFVAIICTTFSTAILQSYFQPSCGKPMFSLPILYKVLRCCYRPTQCRHLYTLAYLSRLTYSHEW